MESKQAVRRGQRSSKTRERRDAPPHHPISSFCKMKKRRPSYPALSPNGCSSRRAFWSFGGMILWENRETERSRGSREAELLIYSGGANDLDHQKIFIKRNCSKLRKLEKYWRN